MSVINVIWLFAANACRVDIENQGGFGGGVHILYRWGYGKESVATAAGEVKVDNAASAENFALASRN